MPFEFHVLPDQRQSAARNMANDFLLLNRYQPKSALRFRHYEWSKPSFTFGLSQAYSYAVSEIPNGTADICRRPTGGGVVNHLEDWTYTLVIPSTHSLAQAQPTESYKAIHECMVAALKQQGVDAVLNSSVPDQSSPTVCFEKSEVFDVVLRNLPSKIAGAAQKRTKAGYLLQGSIWKPLLPNLDWTRFCNDFIHSLATLSDAEISFPNWPVWDETEYASLVDQFESDDWNKRR